MSTTGHETEAVNVKGLKASLTKSGNKGIYNEAICSTAGATAAKVTNTVPPSFSLVGGAKIIVKFTYAILASNATLQVGSNGTPKPIYFQGAPLEANVIDAGTSVLFSYDGTAFNIIGGLGKKYTDMAASGTGHKGGLVPDPGATAGTSKYLREDGSWAEPVGDNVAMLGDDDGSVSLPLFVPGTYTGTCSTAAGTAAKTLDITGYEAVRHGQVAVTFSSGISVAGATLNISSKGAKPIYYRGNALPGGVVMAGDIVTMVYNGTQYEVISIESAPVYEHEYTAVADATGKDPAQEGWYELSGGAYVLTEDTTPASGKTYYVQEDFYSMTI